VWPPPACTDTQRVLVAGRRRGPVGLGPQLAGGQPVGRASVAQLTGAVVAPGPCREAGVRRFGTVVARDVSDQVDVPGEPLNSLTVSLSPTGVITRFGTICPATKFRFEAVGRGVWSAYTVMYPGLVGETTVTLIVQATSAGWPPVSLNSSS